MQFTRKRKRPETNDESTDPKRQRLDPEIDKLTELFAHVGKDAEEDDPFFKGVKEFFAASDSNRQQAGKTKASNVALDSKTKESNDAKFESRRGFHGTDVVVIEAKKNQGSCTFGTGILMQDPRTWGKVDARPRRFVLTAAHCVCSCDLAGQHVVPEIRIRVPVKPWKDFPENKTKYPSHMLKKKNAFFNILISNPNQVFIHPNYEGVWTKGTDIALIAIPEFTPNSSKIFYMWPVTTGWYEYLSYFFQKENQATSCAIVGFPYFGKWSHYPFISSTTKKEDQITEFYKINGAVMVRYYSKTRKGMSGGPILLDNKIVGLHNAGDTAQNYSNGLMFTASLKNWIQQTFLKWENLKLLNLLEDAKESPGGAPFNFEDIKKRGPVVEYKGHQGRLLAIRIESTGHFMFSAGQDSMMKQWEITSGNLVRTFHGHVKKINTIIFSSDDQYIFTASSDNTAKMWVMESGENIKTYRGHTGTLWGLQIYENDTRLITVSTDSTHRIWDIESEQELRQWRDPDGSIYNMDITRDERYIFTGGKKGVCKKWEIATGNLIRKYEKHDGYIQVVFCTRDAKKLASGSEDSTVVIWDIDTGGRIHTLREHSQCIRDLKFTKDERYLFTVADDSHWCIFDVKSGACLMKKWFTSLSGTACDLNFNDSRFITGAEDLICKLWWLKEDENDGTLDISNKRFTFNQDLALSNNQSEKKRKKQSKKSRKSTGNKINKPKRRSKKSKVTTKWKPKYLFHGVYCTKSRYRGRIKMPPGASSAVKTTTSVDTALQAAIDRELKIYDEGLQQYNKLNFKDRSCEVLADDIKPLHPNWTKPSWTMFL